MKKTKIIKQEVEVIDDILCNKCGQSCKIEGDFYGLIETGFSTGYFSPCLPDGNTYLFSLCEECVAKLMDSFEIKAEIEGGFYGEEE